MPGLRIRRPAPPTAPVPISGCSGGGGTSGGAIRCRIPTRIKRATGSSDRYALSAIRALPLRFRGGRRPTSDPAFRHNVVLQATDGHQAVCVLTEGTVQTPMLVPGDVLPTRYADGRSGVTLEGRCWRSNDGLEASDPGADDGTQFPAIGSVLPDVRPVKPGHLARPDNRRSSSSPSIAVAISIDRLRRIAAGLGTDNVTLMIPLPQAQPGNTEYLPGVTQPIAICPADVADPDGVAVMLPVSCDRAQPYYQRVREAVLKAERDAEKAKPTRAKRGSKTSGGGAGGGSGSGAGGGGKGVAA